MWSLIFSQSRLDLHKNSCKVHKVVNRFYSWKVKCWKVSESSVCGSKKLLYYLNVCTQRPLTHQFPPNTFRIIAWVSGGGGGLVVKNIIKVSMLKIKIMPGLQTICSSDGDCKQKTIWEISICRWKGRVITEKNPLGSHFYKRDEIIRTVLTPTL